MWNMFNNSTVCVVSVVIFTYSASKGTSDASSCGKSSGQQAIFRVSVTLAIPNIQMVPSVEEVQQCLNQAVEYVVSVSKGVTQWSKERISKVCLMGKKSKINL